MRNCERRKMRRGEFLLGLRGTLVVQACQSFSILHISQPLWEYDQAHYLR